MQKLAAPLTFVIGLVIASAMPAFSSDNDESQISDRPDGNPNWELTVYGTDEPTVASIEGPEGGPAVGVTACAERRGSTAGLMAEFGYNPPGFQQIGSVKLVIAQLFRLLRTETCS